MKRYALIGFPLGHSLSPFIHKKLFELSKVDAEYSLMPLSAEELKNSGALLSGFAGLNITIPYKVDIIPFCKSLDESAERYRSVNCLKSTESGFVGYNTDVIGFNRSLEALGADVFGKRTLLLGCGGVGRMMALEIASGGADLTIAVRNESLSKTDEIVKLIRSHVPTCTIEITDIARLRGNYDIIINSTPVGMFPEVGLMPISADIIRSAKYLFDAVYNPVEPLLVKTARSLGVKAMAGMAMLVYQAAAAHEIWYGGSFSDEILKKLTAECEKELGGAV